MPQLGETVAEGKIVKWFKSAGDAVKPGDNLFEIETDKTSMEVPATFAGTLSDIRFQVGEIAKVGAVVAVIAGAGEAATAAPQRCCSRERATNSVRPRESGGPGPKQREPEGKNWVPACAGTNGRGTRPSPIPHMDPFREVRTPERNFGPAKLPGGATVTPLARRLAGERGIDLVARLRLRPAWPHRRRRCREGRAGRRAPRMARGASAAQVKALYEGVAYEEVPLDAMRAPSPRGWSRPSRPSRISI